MTRLFGLNHTSKAAEEQYAKNTFPNTFPVALLCWMHSRDIKPRFIEGVHGSRPALNVVERPGSEVFGTANPSSLHYDFEHEFTAFSRFQSGSSKYQTKLDVVASDPGNKTRQIRGIENKLTVVPDASTVNDPCDRWAPEMVLRPASLAAAAMSVFSRSDARILAQLSKAIDRLGLGNIRDWRSEAEMKLKLGDIREFVSLVIEVFADRQTPFLLQPIWATEGTRMKFAPMAFDMLVWTDHSILTLIYLASMDKQSDSRKKKTGGKIGRPQRSVIRIAATFANLVWKGSFNYDSIFRDLSYNDQTDKELSINGKKFLHYLPASVFCERRVPASDIHSIIDENSFEHFSPERRLDTCLYIHNLSRRDDAAAA